MPLEPVLDVPARVVGAAEFEGFAAEEGGCFRICLAKGLWRVTAPGVAVEDGGDCAEEGLVWAPRLRVDAIWLLEEYPVGCSCPSTRTASGCYRDFGWLACCPLSGSPPKVGFRKTQPQNLIQT